MVDPRYEESAGQAAHQIEVLILGPLEVRRDGATVTLPGRRHGLLLLDLALHVGRRISTDTLVDHLWGESPPATATKTVHKYISELRRALGSGVDGWIATAGAGYVADLPPTAIDAGRFEQLVADAATMAGADAIDALARAEALWRGAALDGSSDLPFALPTAQRLEELRLVASERRLGLMISLGRHAAALPELEQLAVEHPLREELHAQLMLARAASGRRADALAAYQRIRRHLADELGIDPSSRLREIEQRILVDADDTPARISTTGPMNEPIAPTRRGARRVPIPISSFVGRVDLLDRVRQALAGGRLVTLTGPGGSGKTRVAIETVQRGDPASEHAYFVDLSVIGADERVTAAVTAAVGLPDQPGTDAADLLREALGSRTTLLLLDNCEHVRGAVAVLTTDLLAVCPDLTVLATSREPLGVPGEQVRPVPPLTLPAPGVDAEPHEVEAVEFFATRARDADPTFELGERELPEVVDICTRLDGMPLALELAAAHVPALTVADINRRLDDRFRILDSGGEQRGRQSTLRATIDWSHQRLDADERLLFERLSVFPGTFELDGAAAVGAVDTITRSDVAGLLSRLVRRSMVVRADDHGDRSRYRLLDTLRAYGRELISGRADDVAVRHAHTAHFAGLVSAADARASSDDRWHLDITAEYHNIQAALQHAIDDDPVLGAELAYALHRYWARTDQVIEGLRHVERLLTQRDLAGRSRAQALCCAAELRTEHGEATIAEREATEAIALFDQLGDEFGAMRARAALGRAIGNSGRYDDGIERMHEARHWFATGDPARWAAQSMSVGHLLLAQGDEERAEDVFGEVLAWSEQRGMGFITAKALWLLGVAARHRGQWDEARARCRRALEAFVELGDRSAIAHVRMTLGDIARLAGDRPGAQQLYTEAYDELLDIGDRRCVASAMKNLGDLARPDEPGTAMTMYLRCLDRRHALGDRVGAAEALEALAGALVDAQRAPAAATLLGHADAVRADTGSMAPAVERSGIGAMHARLAELVPADELDEARRAGATMSLGESVALAHRLVTDDALDVHR